MTIPLAGDHCLTISTVHYYCWFPWLRPCRATYGYAPDWLRMGRYAPTWLRMAMPLSGREGFLTYLAGEQDYPTPKTQQIS